MAEKQKSKNWDKKTLQQIKNKNKSKTIKKIQEYISKEQIQKKINYLILTYYSIILTLFLIGLFSKIKIITAYSLILAVPLIGITYIKYWAKSKPDN